MTYKYNFIKKCPSSIDYETYLNGTGTDEFNKEFKLHLTTCELCNNSLQGYQSNGFNFINETLLSSKKTFLLTTKKSNKTQFRVLSYAASIILLMGLSVIYLLQQNTPNTNQVDNNLDYSSLIENSATKNKTLAKKTNNHFIYISSCDKIAYNDQFLSSKELFDNLRQQKNIDLITVEVATNNYECALNIINSIKHENMAPIITISNSRGIKKLTSWGGALGG